MDADLLSELWSQGRVDDRWWQAWLTPLEVCDQREWLRYRMSLAGIQPRVKIRIHATLHRHGVLNEFSDLFGKEGQAFLQELNADEEITLRRSGKLTLKGHLELLDQVRRQIAEATRELRCQVRANPEAELWRSLPGISWVLTYTIVAEVGRIDRFKTGRRMSNYSLLVPRADDTGLEDDVPPKGRHVGYAGRRTALFGRSVAEPHFFHPPSSAAQGGWEKMSG